MPTHISGHGLLMGWDRCWLGAGRFIRGICGQRMPRTWTELEDEEALQAERRRASDQMIRGGSASVSPVAADQPVAVLPASQVTARAT